MRKRPSTGQARAQEECGPCCGKGPSPALSSRGQGVSQLPEPAGLAGSLDGFAGLGPPFPHGKARPPRPAEPGGLPGKLHTRAVLLSPLQPLKAPNTCLPACLLAVFYVRNAEL